MKIFYTISLGAVLLLIVNTQLSAQTAAKDNIISESITFKDPPTGADIYGIFEGRTPCSPISKQLGATVAPDCDHLKWQVILYRDTLTLAPTAFTLTTELFDRRPLKGKWEIAEDKENTAGTLLVLYYSPNRKPLYLLKGDDNVLFILNDNRQMLTGNEDFSYTLNRVKKVRRLSNP
ncbi:hypothetical protein [Agriterribacter humi]|jgi:hypothetical protein|uniref:hypothetical protein n=1 Tax=Agriterribacter humi TaxID=1104781 RepID=UPI00126559A4|nr:hypothetical protein [Agriterribacter humi]